MPVPPFMKKKHVILQEYEESPQNWVVNWISLHTFLLLSNYRFIHL